MAGEPLLPARSSGRPGAGSTADPEPAVVDLAEAGAVVSALGSGTARRVLRAVCRSPAPAAGVAERVDTSVQNACYHLDRLERAGLLEPVGTRYSRKGTEMELYAATAAPLVLRVRDPPGEGGERTAGIAPRTR